MTLYHSTDDPSDTYDEIYACWEAAGYPAEDQFVYQHPGADPPCYEFATIGGIEAGKPVFDTRDLTSGSWSG